MPGYLLSAICIAILPTASAPGSDPCGSGLLAKAVCQSIILQLNHRARRQATHISHVLPTKSAPGSAPVGAGLLAKALCQSMTLQLNHRYRRQASSHIGHVLPTKSAPGSDPCAGLPAKAVCQSIILQLNHRYRGVPRRYVSVDRPSRVQLRIAGLQIATLPFGKLKNSLAWPMPPWPRAACAPL